MLRGGAHDEEAIEFEVVAVASGGADIDGDSERRPRKDLRPAAADAASTIRVEHEPASLPKSDWGALRVAGLCIGVGKYTHIGPLGNAVRDAEQVNAKLNAVPRCRSGIVKDPKTQIDMLSSVRRFLDDPRLREEPPELFVLSYAVHSLQREGEVYLVPTDAKLEDEAEDC